MQGISYITGSTDLNKLSSTPTVRPFDGLVVEFLSELSRVILSEPEFRAYPETMAFAYWMRKAKLKELSEEFAARESSGILLSRGTAFHIAPANVDTIFLYSMILSMLAGNNNIVRISSKDSEQVDRIIHYFDQLLCKPKFSMLSDRTALIRYERSDSITATLSMICDIRVVWGGDVSVAAIRRFPMQPHATEMCFPDKTSFAVFGAKLIGSMERNEILELAQKFKNDSYVFNQMACSSPHLLVWLGAPQTVLKAKDLFWTALDSVLANSSVEISDVDYVNKLVSEQWVSTKTTISIRKTISNDLTVLSLTDVKDFDQSFRCGSGFFLEAGIETLAQLEPAINEGVQTIVSHGVPKHDWVSLFSALGLRGVDRIVSPGEALDFSPVWDGMDLLSEFTRQISIGVM